MGKAHAMYLYTYWSHLPCPAFRVAMYMALLPKDTDPEPQYWGGREALVQALGRQTPREPADEDKSRRADEFRRRRRNDFEALRLAIKTLVSAGLIAVDKPAAPGRVAVYKLNFTLPIHEGTPQAEPGQRPRRTPATPQTYPGNAPDVPRTQDGAPLRGAPSEDHYEEEDQKVTRENPNWSPNATISPALSTADNPNVLDFHAARTLLESFPDLGESYLSRPEVKAFIGKENRDIAAAQLALREMHWTRRTGTGES